MNGVAETKWKCPDCEEYHEEDDLQKSYECANCGEIFTQDGSADGVSHRCPGCNKFASSLTDKGCPDCGHECEEVEAVFDEENEEWVEVKTTKMHAVGKKHYHVRYTFPDGRTSDRGIEDPYSYWDSLEKAHEFWSHPMNYSVLNNEDGTYTIYTRPDDVHEGPCTVVERIVEIYECTIKHP